MHLFENARSCPYILATLLGVKNCALILTKKWVGLYFGRLFQTLVWSLWLRLVFYLLKIA
jgi:hypothetical protein